MRLNLEPFIKSLRISRFFGNPRVVIEGPEQRSEGIMFRIYAPGKTGSGCGDTAEQAMTEAWADLLDRFCDADQIPTEQQSALKAEIQAAFELSNF